MKKVLLGLLALSTTLMATTPSTGKPGTNGENQIDIKTKAFIVNSGLIITADASGIVAIKSVELDHGTILAGTDTNSTTTRTVYIKRVGNSNFPENTVLEVALNSSENNLINSNGSNKLAHTLTAHVNKDFTYYLSLNGSKKNDSKKFTTNSVTYIPVELTSEITKEQLSSPEGEYNNTSTLSVRFSKNPGMQTEPADKPVEASR